MHDAVQRVGLIMLKRQLGQGFAIERAIAADHARSKGLRNRRVNRLSRLHQLAAQLVGGNHRCAQPLKHARHSALAAAQPPCQANSQHS